jgi:hypothetical protein
MRYLVIATVLMLPLALAPAKASGIFSANVIERGAMDFSAAKKKMKTAKAKKAKKAKVEYMRSAAPPAK